MKNLMTLFIMMYNVAQVYSECALNGHIFSDKTSVRAEPGKLTGSTKGHYNILNYFFKRMPCCPRLQSMA